MSEYTPGPWMHDTVDGFTMVHVDNNGQTGQTIVHMFDRHGPFKNASANARLIAAAPELAKALRFVRGLVLTHGDAEQISRLCDALDKAGL